MKKPAHFMNIAIMASLVLSSCISTRQTAMVHDDVYYSPRQRSAPAVVQATVFDESWPTDDYYDTEEAKSSQGRQDYYDIAYNDPQYYNYNRFGFNAGMGIGAMNGMGMGGMGMGWGGMGMGWGGMGMGGMGMGLMGWNNPWMWNDPWMQGSCGGAGWGMGNYQGPMGNCLNCYAPVVLGGSSNTYMGQRPTYGGGRPGIGGPPGGSNLRTVVRDPVSLDPVQRQRAASTDAVATKRTAPRSWEERGVPASQRQQRQPDRMATPARPNNGSGTSPQRSPAQSRPGGSHGGTYERSRSSSPSTSPGGGSRSPGTGRPR